MRGMKPKMKINKHIKINLIIFTISILAFGIIKIYAATYFPSSSTTYDNSKSGMKSNNVQNALDELYNVCKPEKGGETILNQVNVVTTGDGLYKDNYEEGRYFYKGANPNNYVTFNNELAGWRILSIESDGRIKIIRDIIIGSMEWAIGHNDWNSSNIKTYLNQTYYNTLTTTAKEQIALSNFSIGAATQNNDNLADQINTENSKKWNGKIGLITASDYLRANSNQSSCETMNKNNNNISTCKNTNWLAHVVSNGNSWWSITPDNQASNYEYIINWAGTISSIILNYDSWINSYPEAHMRPVVYISSSAKITGGDGTQSNPYTIP